MATTYTLKAIIPPEQAAKLKENGYILCLGKVVHDASGNPTVNVIWNSDSDFIHENRFEWQETYSIALATANAVGELATAATAIQPISFGQGIAVDAAGSLGPSEGVVTSGPITVYNHCNKLNFALLYCTGSGGTTTQNPIYISGPLQIGFKLELTPIEAVAVWFAPNQATSTIIANASNEAYHVTYLSGATATHTISWVQQTSGEWGWETTA